MEFIKKHYKVSGNSILESVIALSIISVCLYVAIVVYAAVFTPKTTAKFYGTNNKLDEIFFLMQVQNDSVNSIDNLTIEDEWITTSLKQVTIKYKDSAKIDFEKKYYIQNLNE